MKLTFDQKMNRLNSILGELEKQTKEIRIDIMSNRNEVDEMIAQVDRNTVARQEVIDFINTELVEEEQNGKTG